MTPFPTDENLLAKIGVKDVRSYLNLTGWQLVDEQPERIARYTKTRDDTGRQYVITVPLKQSFNDYLARILDLVATLSDAEHRSGEAVALTLIQGRFDSLQARIEEDGSSDGSIDLVDGVAAFQSMKELLLYSAIAEKGPKSVYSSPSYEETKRLLRNSRLAQTQRGSFVLSVVTEVPVQEQPLPGFPDVPEPQPRRVMRRLAAALQAAHDAGIQDTETAFRERVELGLSANFCAAIGRFGRSNKLHGVYFKWRWSWTVAAPDIQQEINFSPQLLRNIRAGAEYLRENVPIDGFRVIGVVDVLKAQGKDTSRVELIEERGGRVKRVHMTLSGPDNEKAINAYKEKQLVTCIGRLEKHGGKVSLLAVRDFVILPGGPLGRPE